MKLNLRKTLADTISMVSLGAVVGTTTELCVAGMNGKECLKSRLLSLPINLLTGRPYGLYRDWVFEKCGGEIPGKIVRNAIIEIGVFASFQGPLYSGVLALSGADYSEISKAVTLTTLLAPVIARPYGLYMNQVRRFVGVKNDS